jgi:hypothetical protein
MRKSSAAAAKDCRRRARRYALPPELEATVDFGYPTPQAHRCSLPAKDVSPSGVSFVLTHELPGLEVGTEIARATLRAGKHAIHGDMVVIHLTPDESLGSTCGTILYPRTDADIVKLKSLIAELESEGGAPGDGHPNPE